MALNCILNSVRSVPDATYLPVYHHTHVIQVPMLLIERLFLAELKLKVIMFLSLLYKRFGYLKTTSTFVCSFQAVAHQK